MGRRYRYTSWVNNRHYTHSNKDDENIKYYPRKRVPTNIIHSSYRFESCPDYK